MGTSMAKYIMSILRTQLCVVWSWGFHNPTAIDNGLEFFVDGYIFKGKVRVSYIEYQDLFTVQLVDKDGSINKEQSEVYLNELVNVVDGMVERCENYHERIKNDYQLIAD